MKKIKFKLFDEKKPSRIDVRRAYDKEEQRRKEFKNSRNEAMKIFYQLTFLVFTALFAIYLKKIEIFDNIFFNIFIKIILFYFVLAYGFISGVTNLNKIFELRRKAFRVYLVLIDIENRFNYIPNIYSQAKMAYEMDGVSRKSSLKNRRVSSSITNIEKSAILLVLFGYTFIGIIVCIFFLIELIQLL